MVSALVVVELIYIMCVGVLIILGNALVVLAFWKGPRQIRTLTNYFVLNLSFSDLLVGCFSVPFRVCVKLGITKEGSANYDYFIVLDVLCGTASILCLTAISIERMFAVKYPTMHHNLSRKPVLIAIAVTWIVGLLLAAVKLTFGAHKIKSPYTLLILLTSFFVPLFVIIGSYIIIFFTAISVTQSANLTKEIRVAKTISVIIGLFAICWMPFFIANMLYFYCADHSSTNLCKRLHNSPWVVDVVISLRISNSMMNFFVYAVRSPIFRSTFQTLVFNLCGTTSMRAKVFGFSAYHNASKKTYSTKKNTSQREQKKDLGEKLCNNKNNSKSRDIAESIYLNSKDIN